MTANRYNREIHHRRSVRLKGHDYSRSGAYFVTICAYDRECLFGDVADDGMRLNDYGRVVQACWDEILYHFREVQLDAFVVMPNHVHGILVCTRAEGSTPTRRGTACRAPTTERFGRPVIGSLPTMIRSFKSAITKRINILRGVPGLPVWQRNYHEHIIRDEGELLRIRDYIVCNPAHWPEDENHPDRISSTVINSEQIGR
jgi:putative transposase